MKVILLRDVAKIGRKDQVVEVPDGYAQNQLIPKKWALPATPQNLKKNLAAASGTAAKLQSEETAFLEAVAALKQTVVEIHTDANEQGHLFKAVHEADVVAAAREKGIGLAVSQVKIAAPIKSLGTHDITFVHKNTSVSYQIIVSKK